MCWHWGSHPQEALESAVRHLLVEVRHDDLLVFPQPCGEEREARQAHQSLKVLIIEPLVESLIGSLLDASHVRFLGIFPCFLLVSFILLIGCSEIFILFSRLLLAFAGCENERRDQLHQLVLELVLLVLFQVQYLGLNEFNDRVCNDQFVHLHYLEVANFIDRRYIRGYFALQKGSNFSQKGLHTDVTRE